MSTMPRFIFVSGGVISGIGKGVVTASVANLLKGAGYQITPIKCENYLNVDSGTINPIEHGDPFLCDDGCEADMDLGTYEKFMNQNMGRKNFITMGQIYQTVIDRERRFEYKGEDVEAIPHITDEIQKRWFEDAAAAKAEIVIVELGGTAGEYQNIFYYEAARMLALRNPGKVIHIHVGYMPTPAHLGEPKTKPIQLSVRTLNSMGIQPDIIVARSEKEMDKRRKDRFALFCNVYPEDVITAPDARTIYEVPLMFEKQNLTDRILSKFGLKRRKKETKKWETMVQRILAVSESKKEITIGIIGKYFATGEYELQDSYAALFDAIRHAAWHEGIKAKTVWINAQQVEKYGIEKYVDGIDGMIVPIGWGERGVEGMVTAGRYAITHKMPYLGLCYGMQLGVVAFAREKLGWNDANTTEVNPKTKHPVIHLMKAQEALMKRRAYGGTMRLGAWEAYVKKGTKAYAAYEEFDALLDNKGLTSERHRHRYEFNDDYAKQLTDAGLIIAARSKVENLAEIVELPDSMHPFFMGTQGHPEYKSRPDAPHPLFVSFIRACRDEKKRV